MFAGRKLRDEPISRDGSLRLAPSVHYYGQVDVEDGPEKPEGKVPTEPREFPVKQAAFADPQDNVVPLFGTELIHVKP